MAQFNLHWASAVRPGTRPTRTLYSKRSLARALRPCPQVDQSASLRHRRRKVFRAGRLRLTTAALPFGARYQRSTRFFAAIAIARSRASTFLSHEACSSPPTTARMNDPGLRRTAHGTPKRLDCMGPRSDVSRRVRPFRPSRVPEEQQRHRFQKRLGCHRLFYERFVSPERRLVSEKPI